MTNTKSIWHRALPAAAAVVIVSAAGAQTVYRTGFEPFPMDDPGFFEGSIHGQNDWMVTPELAIGMVQRSTVCAGDQALELIDAASFGRAQHTAAAAFTPGSMLAAQYDMFIPLNWRETSPDLQDRFEAQTRLEFSGTGGTVGLEFGLLTTFVEYNGLPAGSTAYFIEVTMNEQLVASSYDLVDFAAAADAWHEYRLYLNATTGVATLMVDRGLRGTVAGLTGLTGMSTFQLQNQRWGSNPNDNASVFYDDVFISVTATPSCVGDLDGDGDVDTTDLNIMLSNFGCVP